MSKIKVLVLPSDRTGVGKFRSVDPHIFLQELYPEEFHVDIVYDPPMNDFSFWQNYQIVHYHRTIGQDFNQSKNFVEVLNSIGVVTIIDLDYYCLPCNEHPIHDIIVTNKIHERIIENLKVAKYVTTTTSIFADEIKKYNKNVIVLPNGINPKESQFKEPTEKYNKLRFGWLGGSSHLHDLMLMDGTISKLSEVKDKMKFFICGFDTRGTITEINRQTGEQKQRPIKPEETVWYEYEKIFTANYGTVSEDYKSFL